MRIRSRFAPSATAVVAISSATRDYRERHADDFGRTDCRRCGDLAVSNVGVGTYLGDPTDDVAESSVAASAEVLKAGVDAIGTHGPLGVAAFDAIFE